MFFEAGRNRVALAAALVCAAWLGCWGSTPAFAAPGDPNTMPPATYPVTYSKQQWITMDDGIQLGATITFPSQDGKAPAPGKFPVILSMTPYGRDGGCACAPANDFATRGFAVAVVDVRGTGGSQGNLDQNYFSPREARDGYDLVESLGTQPWSTGKVGMSGGSYVGITQFKTAETAPPHLAAIAPDEALADIYNDAYAPGGIVSLSFDAQYLAVQGGPGLLTPNSDPSMIPGTITAKQQQATGRPIAFDYLENPFDDQFYADRSPITGVRRIRVPVFVEDGWRDAFEAGDIRMFEALARRGVPTYLNIGPCTHKGCGPPFAPTDNPPNLDNVEAQEVRFDQRYLMGMDVALPAPVRLYDQQANKYADATRWPPPSTSFKRQYLDGGSIAAARPAASSDSYFTNPAAGFSMSLDEQGTVAASPYVPTDQRLEDGQGLTWRGPTLTGATTLAGPIALHLVASSSATDTDWFAKLSDVAPDGSESIVSEGQLRASLRALAPGSTPEQPLQSLTAPQPLAPGRFYDFEIAIAPTDYTFAPGHRLQLRLASGNLPNALPGTLSLDEADPAASGFTPIAPATNTVRFGGADGTSLLLPIYGSAPGASRTARRRAVTPVARASVRRVPGSANRFRLNARRSSGRGSRIVSYRWMLGTRVLSRRAVFTHTFAYRAGRPYRVRLIVIAASGRRASTVAVVRPRR